MVLIPVHCPYYQSEQVIKGGKTDTGKQRYRRHNPNGTVKLVRDAADRCKTLVLQSKTMKRDRELAFTAKRLLLNDFRPRNLELFEKAGPVVTEAIGLVK